MRAPTLPRSSVLALPVLALVALALAPASPSVVADEEATVPCVDPRGCPDLIVTASTFAPFVSRTTFGERSCAVEEGMTKAGTRTLLRFTFTTPNLGPGDLFVGDPERHPEWFEWGDCHNHWHFREYADYRLWTPEGFEAWHALRVANPELEPSEVLAAHPGLANEVVAGHKQGFCVIDLMLYSIGVPKYVLCELQGISVGWADEYHHSLDGQWIDVTGLRSGKYVLEAEVNAERLFEEANYANNRAFKPVEI